MNDATCIDQSVKLSDTAWAVGDYDLNQRSVSIELAGEASQTPVQWADFYSKAELTQAAKLTAQLCKELSIPVRKVSPNDIARGISGIAGHLDVTLAKKIYGGHWDPGKNFPWNHFIAEVKIEFEKLK